MNNKKEKECKIILGNYYLRERKINDLSKIEVSKITNDDEESIKIAPEDDDKKCFGGVILKNKRQDIVLKNTLDLRCEMAFQLGLPEIRRIIMPRTN